MADDESFLFDPREFARALPPATLRATPRGVVLVEPDGFRLSDQTASDNSYMNLARTVDPERALAQHRTLAEAIRRQTRLPVHVFAGDARSPDAVFCNNVFGTAPGRLVVGAMRHPERRRESLRDDIVETLRAEGREVLRIDHESGAVAELTGPLVIDRARAIGLHGLSERCNVAGARAMHRAFGLSRSLAFPLGSGEYHTNVLMAVLGGRTLVVHESSIGTEVVAALAPIYAPHVLRIDDAEKSAFVANCIGLTPGDVWMSASAERALSAATRAGLRRARLVLHTVEIDEIEKAGGSLRCCVAEVF